MEGAFAHLLDAAVEHLLQERDPLQVEVVVSQICGAWWCPGPIDLEHDPEVVLGEALISYAERCAIPAAQALLRGLAALGTDRQRSLATAAADRLAARGIAEPPWVDQLGGVRVTGCFAYGDVYGDQTSVLLGFERGGHRHSVTVLVEHNMGEIATDALLTGAAEDVLAGVSAVVRQRKATLRMIDPAGACGIVEAAMAATQQSSDAPLTDNYQPTRSLLLARLRTLPPARFTRLPVPGPAERAQILAEFLASRHSADLLASRHSADLPASRRSAGLVDRDVVARIVGLVLDHSCAYDENRLLRVSPMKTQVFLLAWVPLKAVLSDRERDAVPAVVVRWARWAAEQGGLPPWARTELDEAVADLGGKFPGAYADPYRAGPAKTWVLGPDGGVPDLGELRAVLDRRTFAMPYIGTRIGDVDYPQLDANNAPQRRLLIIGEHPEYHEVLGDPDHAAPVAGTTPELHVGTHEVVATQLWNDDPPEAWQAAQRLTASGVARHDVLHALGDLVTRHLAGGSATEQELTASDAYRRDLDALGRTPPAQGHQKQRFGSE